jgi:hypothetical protein
LSHKNLIHLSITLGLYLIFRTFQLKDLLMFKSGGGGLDEAILKNKLDLASSIFKDPLVRFLEDMSKERVLSLLI